MIDIRSYKLLHCALGAICGLYLGEMLSSKKSNDLLEIIKEAVDVANAMGIKSNHSMEIDYYKIAGAKADSGFGRIIS